MLYDGRSTDSMYKSNNLSDKAPLFVIVQILAIVSSALAAGSLAA